MSIEPGPSSSASPQNDFGSLQGCFVEGSPEQRKRERRIRRRALIISVAAQAAILAAIILVPLFGKPKSIAMANIMPIPPYFHPSRPTRTPPTLLLDQTSHTSESFPRMPFLSRRSIPDRIDETPEPPSSEPPGIPTTAGPGTPCVGCIPMVDDRRQPDRPADVRPQTAAASLGGASGTGHADPPR